LRGTGFRGVNTFTAGPQTPTVDSEGNVTQ
jgi:hypothetical protein